MLFHSTLSREITSSDNQTTLNSYTNMLQVPDHVLGKLQCAKCGGYLSCGPILITKLNEQVCGRCSKLLPEESKRESVRQIGLEALAELFDFPCKYYLQGCTFTFPWNSGFEHEITCPHRNNSLPFQSSSPQNEYKYQSEEIELRVLCGNTYDFDEEEKLKLNLDITGKDENKLFLGDSLNHTDKIKLRLQLVVSLEVVPKVTYSHVYVEKQKEEPIYDTVAYMCQNIKCAKCQKNILSTEIFRCPFGHSFCKICRNTTCVICDILPNSKSHHYCRNYIKGCTDLFPTCDITKHEIDCEFNDFKCPLCEFVEILTNVVTHFVQSHEVVLSNELTIKVGTKDQNWYFYYKNKLFRCRYYSFGESVEFIVTYIGCNDMAGNYKYEVSITGENFKSTKSAKCLGWNEVSLGKSVCFDVANNVKQNLQVRITIL